MSIRQLTETLDNLFTTTWANRQAGVQDQIFDATPFWFFMKEQGALMPQEGGRRIEESLMYAKNDSVKWIGKGGTVSMNDNEILTTAYYDWRYLVANVVRFGVDDQQNRGKSKIIDYISTKLDNAELSLEDEMELALTGTAGSNRPGDQPGIDGLQFIIPDDPTSSSNNAGNIDPSTYSWWRNQADNMTGVSFATSGVSRMTTMLNNCGQNKSSDMPNLILSDQTTYERYEEEGRSYLQLVSTKLAEMGFDTQTFKGRPMIWSPQVSQRMYFLNTRYLKFIYDPIMFFDMTEWKAVPDQVNDRAAQIIMAGAFTTNRRRVHGVMYNLDTA